MRRTLFLLCAFATAACMASACDGDDDVAVDDSDTDASTGSSGRPGSSGNGSGSSSSSSGGGSSGGSSSSSGGPHPTDICLVQIPDAGEGLDAGDAGDAGDAEAAPVGGSQCSDCFYGNEQCSADLRCECNPDSPDLRCFCLPGTRGTGAFNSPCTEENQCASGLCIAGVQGDDLPADTPRFCSKVCSGPSECAAPLGKCVINLCIPAQ